MVNEIISLKFKHKHKFYYKFPRLLCNPQFHSKDFDSMQGIKPWIEKGDPQESWEEGELRWIVEEVIEVNLASLIYTGVNKEVKTLGKMELER